MNDLEVASTFKEAADFEMKGQYPEAAERYIKIAERCPKAYFRLYSIFDMSEEEEGKKEAADFLIKGAKLGDDRCLYIYGYLLLLGDYPNIAKDVDEGIASLLKSAEKNNPDACLTLGYVYSEEKYGLQSMEKSLDYYGRAANLDPNFRASYFIAKCRFGVGDHKTNLQALKRLADQDDKTAANFLGLYYVDRFENIKNEDGIDEYAACQYLEKAGSKKDSIYAFESAECFDPNFSDFSFVDAKKAYEFYLNSNEKREALYRIGLLHQNGYLKNNEKYDGPEEDYPLMEKFEQAVEYYKAISQTIDDDTSFLAAENVAMFYYATANGDKEKEDICFDHVRRCVEYSDETKVWDAYCFAAIRLFREGFSEEKAVSLLEQHEEEIKNEKPEQANLLACAYYFGIGTEENYERAHEFLSILENSDSPDYCLLGLYYYEGRAVSQDYEKAFGYFTKAMENDFVKGYYYLGEMYENGYYVEKDIEKAISLYSEVKDQCDDALAALIRLGVLEDEKPQEDTDLSIQTEDADESNDPLDGVDLEAFEEYVNDQTDADYSDIIDGIAPSPFENYVEMEDTQEFEDNYSNYNRRLNQEMEEHNKAVKETFDTRKRLAAKRNTFGTVICLLINIAIFYLFFWYVMDWALSFGGDGIPLGLSPLADFYFTYQLFIYENTIHFVPIIALIGYGIFLFVRYLKSFGGVRRSYKRLFFFFLFVVITVTVVRLGDNFVEAIEDIGSFFGRIIG